MNATKIRKKRKSFSSVSFIRSVSYNSGHTAIKVALAWEKVWGGHDKLCKLFWRVNTFSSPGMGRVSPKLVGQNKDVPALPPSNL